MKTGQPINWPVYYFVFMVKEDLFPIVIDLLEAVEKNKHHFSTIGVSNGISGIALLYICLYHSTGEVSYADKAREIIFDSIEKLNNDYGSRIIFREIAEMGIMLELSRNVALIGEELDDLLTDFDDVLFNEMKEQIHQGNYDPVTGALAQGNYFLSRKNSAIATEALALLDEFLMHSAIWEGNMAYWKSKLKEKETVYLGLSHGSAAIINYLITRSKNGFFSKDKEQLISAATNYILSKEIKNNPVFFPVQVGERYKDDQVYSNNLCYGDPGTLYGLLTALQFLNRADEMEMLRKMTCLAAKRDLSFPYLSSGYSLLYGKAGLYSLYAHLSEKLDSPELGRAAARIFADLVAAYDEKDDFRGYRGHWNQQIETTNFSFIEGIAGIAVTLLSGISPIIGQYHRAYFNLN